MTKTSRTSIHLTCKTWSVWFSWSLRVQLLAPGRWKTTDGRSSRIRRLIEMTELKGGGFCQCLYFQNFRGDVPPPYRFRWFVPVPYDIRTYVISNVSAVDVASSNNGNGTVLTANGVTSTADTFDIT